MQRNIWRKKMSYKLLFFTVAYVIFSLIKSEVVNAQANPRARTLSQSEAQKCKARGGTWLQGKVDQRTGKDTSSCITPISPSSLPRTGGVFPTPRDLPTASHADALAKVQKARQTVAQGLKEWQPFIAHLAKHAGLDATAVQKVLNTNEYLDRISWIQKIATQPADARFTTGTVKKLAQQQGLNPEKALAFLQSEDLREVIRRVLQTRPRIGQTQPISTAFGSLGYKPKPIIGATKAAPSVAPASTSGGTLRDFILSKWSDIEARAKNTDLNAESLKKILISPEYIDYLEKVNQRSQQLKSLGISGMKEGLRTLPAVPKGPVDKVAEGLGFDTRRFWGFVSTSPWHDLILKPYFKL
jgi:hypothetical protein